ncbi:MAG TPA: hypothetical protein VM680_08900 [Verrucomicrobiae bacterium]|nr:hypothetical protein [Verrucomicrobiae bacterium]
MTPPQPTFTTTGGVRIGWISHPLAKLSADATKIEIKVRMLGTYTFAPEDIVSIQRYSILPIIASGIRIEHANLKYPRRVIFWSLKSPEFLSDGITSTGFAPKAPRDALENFRNRRGFALRWEAILALLLLWNIPMALMIFWPIMAVVTLALFFVGSLTVLNSPLLQRLILNDGHHFEEIQAYVRLLPLVLGFMLIGWSVIFATSPEIRKAMRDPQQLFKNATSGQTAK